MKKVIEEEMHQHIDANRVPFGKLHPVSKNHRKKSTQAWHDHTLYISQHSDQKTTRY